MINVMTMKDVYKKYPNGVVASNGINVEITRGEFVYVVGPSGAGKSTFIKMMYREEVPTSGDVLFKNTNLSKLRQKQVPYFRRRIGVVFQDFKLLPKLNVFENVAFALEVIEESPENIRRKVNEVLGLVGLTRKARMFPDELSGGEQQRVSIARAIVNKPELLIADEPTGNLDPETSWEIMKVLEDINALGTTIIMATHNREVVNAIRRRVIAIEGGLITRDEAGGDYGYES